LQSQPIPPPQPHTHPHTHTLARLLCLIKILYYSPAPQYTSLVSSTLSVRQREAVRAIYSSRTCLNSDIVQQFYLGP
jgi:hypothetical protein